MKNLFVLVFVGLCSQGFCMDRGITADMNSTQESSSSYHISDESLEDIRHELERLDYIVHRCDILTEMLRRGGQSMRGVEGIKAQINMLLGRHGDLSDDMLCKINNLCRHYYALSERYDRIAEGHVLRARIKELLAEIQE